MKQAMLALVFLGLAGEADAKAVRCAPADDAVIKTQFDRLNAAWATRNADTVTALFAPDAVLMPTMSSEARTTSAAIHDFFVGFLKKSPTAQINTSTIRIGCNMAARMGNWSIISTDPATAQKRVTKARYTFVYVFERGKWMIVHAHSSLSPEGH